MTKKYLIFFICFCVLLFSSVVPRAQAQDDSLVRRLLGTVGSGVGYVVVRNCLKEIAIDPSSLSTRNFAMIDRDNWVGEVNWRNTFGGMTGWTPYAARWDNRSTRLAVSVGGETRYCNLPFSGQ
jgi:hypothetical protein